MRPRSVEELAAAVADAGRRGARLLPVCMGSKAFMGPPVEYDELLELTSLPRELEVDDEEFVLRASACTPAAEVQEYLTKRDKRLALDPPLFEKSSVGGIVSTNFYGPLAYRYMTPRDQLLSVRAVTGEGKTVKFGAPVMKDVAGYNLKRVLAGSWGTLAVITEVYMRVYALPDTVAVAVTTPRPLGEVRRLLPTAAAERNGVLYLRFEGVKSEVEYRLGKTKPAEVYYGAEAERMWRSVTSAEDLFSHEVVLKAVAPPAQLPPPPRGAQYLRYPLLGVMFVAGASVEGAAVYQLKPPAKWALENTDLMARLKKIFDPRNVLSPGRFP
ncbi:MAG: FAD-binding oxidoreductase [Pyrobaculum sp.]